MPTNPSRHTYSPGQDIPCVASTTIVGARFVLIGTNGTKPNPNIKPCTAAAKPFGVARYDTAVGAVVDVMKAGVVLVKAGANLTAGQEVESDGTGQAIVLAAGKAAGRVVYDAASGALAEIDLYS